MWSTAARGIDPENTYYALKLCGCQVVLVLALVGPVGAPNGDVQKVAPEIKPLLFLPPLQ
jgi:hypothetical protein